MFWANSRDIGVMYVGRKYTTSSLWRLVMPLLPIRYVYTGTRIRIFIPSRIRSQKDSGSQIRINKNLSILTQTVVSKLSQIWSGMFIPNPDLYFFPIPDPGVKKAPNPDLQHWVTPWCWESSLVYLVSMVLTVPWLCPGCIPTNTHLAVYSR